MYNILKEIREQLFDAPTEIKKDFNKLVEFFDVHEWSYLMIEYFRPDVIKDIQMQIEPEDLYTKGDKGLEEFTHVTVAPKLENNLNIEKLKSCLKDIGEYSGIIEETSIFELPEYDVLKCDVRCDNLNLANKIIKTLFTLHAEFTEYQPHMTIAYLQKGKGKKYIQKFTSTEIKPRRFVLSNGGSKEVVYFEETPNENYPDLVNLPNGIYKGRLYGPYFEVEETGDTYKSGSIVKNSRKLSAVHTYKKDGNKLIKID